MNWTGLAARLAKKYGLGENPMASRRVYAHVERLCHAHGDPVYIIVQDMAQYADSRDNPGRNFRAFVLKRIEEHGFPTKPPPSPDGAGPRPTDAAVQQQRETVGSLTRRVAEGGGSVEF